MALKQRIIPYLPHIIPGLLKMVQHDVVAQISGSNTVAAVEEIVADVNGNINTYATEEKELGMQTLITFVDELQEHYSPYLEQTMLVTLPLVNYTMNDNVRAAAANLLPSLLKCDVNIERAKQFLNELWNAVSSEFDSDT